MAKMRGLFYRVIRNAIKKKKIKKRDYYAKIETPEDLRMVGVGVKRENAELQAKLAKAETQNEKLGGILKGLKDEQDSSILKEVKLQEMEIKRLKRQDTYRLLFKFPTKSPPHILSVLRHKHFKGADGGLYKYWRGIEIVDSQIGPLMNLLVSKSPKDKEIGVLEGPSFGSLFDLFNVNTLVNDLKTGRLVVNISPEGKFIPSTLYAENPFASANQEGADEPPLQDDSPKDNSGDNSPKKKDNKPKKKSTKEEIYDGVSRIMKIDMDTIIKDKDPETVQAFLALYNENASVRNQLRMSKESERNAITDKLNVQVENEGLEKSVDRLTTMTGAYNQELDKAYDELEYQAKGKIEADFRQAIADAMEHKLWSALNNALEQVEGLGREQKEVIKESVQKDQIFNMNQLIQAITAAGGLVPEKIMVQPPKAQQVEAIE